MWLYFRRELREILPLWVRGGIHLGTAYVAATWAIVTLLVLVGLVMAWEPVGSVLEIGKGFVGTAALTGISVAYLPNIVMAGAALMVGGEAHLGQASYSVFAVSRGPMPEVPLAAALPTTNPHWVVQGLLLVTVVLAAGLARSVAHWFRTTVDAVKATWLAAALVALVIALSPIVAGGQLGMLGMVGTGSFIAAAMALLLFGIIGSATVALSLAGLTRRRERAESELERRRRRAGTVPVAEDELPDEEPHNDEPDDDEPDDEEPDDDESDATGSDAEAPVDAQADLDVAPDEDVAVDVDPPSPTEAEGPQAAGSDDTEPQDAEPAEGDPGQVESAEDLTGDPTPDEPEPDDATGLPDEGRGAAD